MNRYKFNNSLYPKCGAKTRQGTSCKRIARKTSGRCKLHGGASTGPKTQDGLENSKKANWKHGFRSEKCIGDTRQLSFLIKASRLVYGDGKYPRSLKTEQQKRQWLEDKIKEFKQWESEYSEE